ncbi:hypothetical protein C1E24_14395 [Pseudoalteromonas phenolica]|uniref:Uncharacterized protein n=1 Tax=Pseudoalteromonas phenolica TaxID=161398 RepID=A0A5R9PZM2_9GAMM|nr:hypothetical protein [Pseudoalteromonas phenolica]TLX46353.1 hypothetical protein C1E24_14395 [Pseudoalteromonas phenolica]
MKKLIGISFFAIVLALFVFLNDEDMSVSEKVEIIQASNNEMPKNEEALKQTKQDTKEVHQYVPFPVNAPSKEECLDIDVKRNRLNDQFESDLDASAYRLLNQGDDPNDIADAIWDAYGWHKAQDWYYNARILQAIDAKQAFFKKLQNSDALLEKFTNLDQSIKLPNFERELEVIWSNYQFIDVEKAIIDGKSDEEILELLIQKFTSVPHTILNDPYVSPLSSLSLSLVKARRYSLAAKVLTKYPNLVRRDSRFESRLQVTILQEIGLAEVLKSEKISDVISLIKASNASKEAIYYPHVEMRFFNNEAVKETLLSLQKKGIDVNYIHTNDTKPEALNVNLNIPNRSLPADSQAKLDLCEVKKDWWQTRQLKHQALKQFEKSKFIEQLTTSPESSYCETMVDSFKGIESLVKQKDFKALSIIKNYIRENNITSLDAVSLEDFAGIKLSKLDRDVLVLLLSEQYLASNEYSHQEILNRFKAVNLTVSNEHLYILPMFIRNGDVVTLWLDEIAPSSEEVSLLLNSLSEEAYFDKFSLVEKKFGDTVKTTDLDYFYFFLKDFSGLSFSFGGNSASRQNQSFVEYFQQNGYRVEDHHRRVMFKHKESNAEDYRFLVNAFPDLEISTVPEYFEVNCL